MESHYELESQIKELEKITGKEYDENDMTIQRLSVQRNCFNSIWIMVAVTPVIMFLLLYFVEPAFIQEKVGNRWVIDNKKLWMYWALFTFIVWILLFLYAFSRGYASNSEMCY